MTQASAPLEPGETVAHVWPGGPGSRPYLAALAAGRHPATVAGLRRLAYIDLAPELRAVAEQFAQLGHWLIGALPDGPELTATLRKLAESRDCAVVARRDHLDGV